MSVFSLSCRSAFSIFSNNSEPSANTQTNIQENVEDSEPAEMDESTENDQTANEDDGSSDDSSQGDYPILVVEDAYDFEDYFGLYSYNSNKPLEEVAEFYRTEMIAQGYDLQNDVKTFDAVILSLEGAGEIVTINIVDNGDGTVTVRYADATP
ncbi:MAG TPA: hypothetical protein VJ965_06095 [Anaerolineales bacterium]|nr:hypothetical protein [Anaerolineales bacterium]